MEEWGFIWVMVILKIPLVALLWLVWWSIHATPEPAAQDDDGGDGGLRRHEPTDPRLPHGPRRRGPHGDPVVPSPPRTRVPAHAAERGASPSPHHRGAPDKVD